MVEDLSREEFNKNVKMVMAAHVAAGGLSKLLLANERTTTIRQPYEQPNKSTQAHVLFLRTLCK
jgi:hypothetical protein